MPVIERVDRYGRLHDLHGREGTYVRSPYILELDFGDKTRPWARVHVGRVAHYPKVYSLCFHLSRQAQDGLVIFATAFSVR